MKMQRTPFGLHVAKYGEKGCGAPECKKAQSVCLVRGDVPADVLFIGEAPGESEDAIGLPFSGPAGQLLDNMVERAFRDGRLTQAQTPRICFTNVVGCIPRLGSGKADEPPPEQIEHCRNRFLEMIMLADGKDPKGAHDHVYMNSVGTLKMVVLLGTVAQTTLDPKNWIARKHKVHRQLYMLDLPHPAYLLRLNVAERGLKIQTATVRLFNHWVEQYERSVKERRG